MFCLLIHFSYSLIVHVFQISVPETGWGSRKHIFSVSTPMKKNTNRDYAGGGQDDQTPTKPTVVFLQGTLSAFKAKHLQIKSLEKAFFQLENNRA